MILFDERGHVFPYEVIEMTLEQFEQVFVEGLEDVAHRRRLFSRYLQFVNELKKVFPSQFFQWVGGSFATKKPFPGDIDVVTFIDYRNYEKNEPSLRALKKSFRACPNFGFRVRNCQFFDETRRKIGSLVGLTD